MIMHVLLLSLSLSTDSHALPGNNDTGAADTGATDTGATDTGAADTGATDTGSTGGSYNGSTEFYTPDDADGYGTNGAPPDLGASSNGCGGAAFVIAAPLLLLGLRRKT